MIRIGQQLRQPTRVELLGGRVIKVEVEPGVPAEAVIRISPHDGRNDDSIGSLAGAPPTLREAPPALNGAGVGHRD